MNDIFAIIIPYSTMMSRATSKNNFYSKWYMSKSEIFFKIILLFLGIVALLSYLGEPEREYAARKDAFMYCKLGSSESICAQLLGK